MKTLKSTALILATLFRRRRLKEGPDLNQLDEQIDPQELSGFGGEELARERNGSNVVLSRGRYVIHISTVADVESAEGGRNPAEAELETRRKTEVQRIEKECAKELSPIELYRAESSMLRIIFGR